MDFTLNTYNQILSELIQSGYEFQTFSAFIRHPKPKSVILRHDVDLLPKNSLEFARIQAAKNVKGVYYFRSVPQSWDEKIIKEISLMGHEIGYHYECLTTHKGNVNLAIEQFKTDLEKLRAIANVDTVCMHGSPMSKFDSKDLWKEYNYEDFGIIGEPYFDVNFNEVLYLTDTGRTWKNKNISVRDHVDSKYTFDISSSNDIIEKLKKGDLPGQIMFNFHPQRWTNKPFQWTKELVLQNIKNQIKRIIVKA